MSGLEISRNLRIIVDDLAGVTSDDEVAVLTDESRLDLALDLTTTIRGTGATAVLVVIPEAGNHGKEPPDIATGALKRADIAFLLTTYAITHTDAHREIIEAGTRVSSMRGVDEDMLKAGPSLENYEDADRLAVNLRDRLTAGSEVSVISPGGTDVKFSIVDRNAFALGMGVNDVFDVVSFPQGETALAPVEGTAEGTVVIDHAMDNIGLVEEPLVLHFSKGHAVSIDGGPEAATLREIIEHADDNATNLGEFAIGTLRDARLTGNLKEAKKRYGTVHFAIGDNKTLGGSVWSDVHFDAVVLEPTVSVDGDIIVENGEIII